MRTCLDAAARADLATRLHRLQPDTPGRWGSLDAPRMLAHLLDSFAIMAGGQQASPPDPLPPRFLRSAIVRWLMIDTSLPWPRGKVVAPPEFTASAPTVFAIDRERVIAELERFAEPSAGWPEHPAFGRLPTRQWGRLAWKHMDHHLKQFGV
jgi:hypothetical protein